MTIDPIHTQETQAGEKRALSVQMDIQKDVYKQSVGPESLQQQILQVLASAQPVQSIQQTAQNQLTKGYLDIKI